MKNLLILLLLFSVQYCASSDPATRAADGSGDKSMVDIIKEKAESEEGKKYIEMAKEKIKDPETQAKLKGLLGKDKIPAK